MTKVILRSLPPKQCERIATGAQTIVLSKVKPKLNTPYKEYLYEAKASKKEWHFNVYHEKTIDKVVGEFVCDKVETIACHKYNNGVGFDYTYYTDTIDNLTEETQLMNYDIQQYLGCAEDGECVGYGLHISQLKIYDKPKELGEFRRWNKSFKNDRLTSPPQSWMYVEELRE